MTGWVFMLVYDFLIELQWPVRIAAEIVCDHKWKRGGCVAYNYVDPITIDGYKLYGWWVMLIVYSTLSNDKGAVFS